MHAEIIFLEVERVLSDKVMERVIELRKARGLNQSQMAEMLGLAQQSYGHYESKNERRRVTVDMLPVFAKALETTIEDLLGLSQQKGKRGPTSKLEACFEQSRHLSKKDQQYIVDTIERVVASNIAKAS